MEKRKLRQHLIVLAGSFVFLLCLVAAAEIWTRRTHPYIPELELYAPRSNFEAQTRNLWGEQIFKGDALLGWKIIPDLKEVFWDFTTLTTNRDGLRYPEYIPAKKDGELRILAVGDSVTFGYRVPVSFPQDPAGYIKEQLAYPLLLEKYLRDAYPDRIIRVIPVATPGYTTHQGLALLGDALDRYEPDLVMIMFGWNDQELHPLPDKEALPHGVLRVTARKIVGSSQFLIYFSKWVYGSGDTAPEKLPADDVPRVSQDDYVANILKMQSLAEQHGTGTLILGPVYQDLESNSGQGKNIMNYRSALKSAAQSRGLHYLEVEEMTERGFPDNQRLFQEPIHPNYLGHRLIAERLYAYLREFFIK